MMKNMISQIQQGLDTYLPNVMQNINIPSKVLNEKITTFVAHFLSHSADTCIPRPNSIFMYILGAQKGNRKYADFLKFIDDEIKKLLDICNGDQCKVDKIKEKTKNVIIDFDKNTTIEHPNPSFMNYLAELLYASHIIPLASTRYDFFGFDVKIDNGKDADLAFRRKDNGQVVFFDNMSIHYVELEKLDSPQDLKDFLIKRIEDKLNQKTTNLAKTNGGYIVNGAPSEFYVAPFLWNETSDMLPYKEVFEEFKVSENLNYYFCALFPQLQADGQYVYEIQMIDNILERWSELTKQS